MSLAFLEECNFGSMRVALCSVRPPLGMPTSCVLRLEMGPARSTTFGLDLMRSRFYVIWARFNLIRARFDQMCVASAHMLSIFDLLYAALLSRRSETTPMQTLTMLASRDLPRSGPTQPNSPKFGQIQSKFA